LLQATKTDVEQCEDGSTSSSWFRAVNSNDVNSVQCRIEQEAADVDALQVRIDFRF